LGKDPTVERAQLAREPGLPEELAEGFAGWDEPPMRDLELRLPHVKYDVSLPKRSHEDQALLVPANACPSTEPEQHIGRKRCAGFLPHLAPQGVNQAFVRFGPAAGQVPVFAVATDQDDVSIGEADRGCAMRRPEVVDWAADTRPRANPDRSSAQPTRHRWGATSTMHKHTSMLHPIRLHSATMPTAICC